MLSMAVYYISEQLQFITIVGTTGHQWSEWYSAVESLEPLDHLADVPLSSSKLWSTLGERVLSKKNIERKSPNGQALYQIVYRIKMRRNQLSKQGPLKMWPQIFIIWMKEFELKVFLTTKSIQPIFEKYWFGVQII